jgi:hypothetical protein
VTYFVLVRRLTKIEKIEWLNPPQLSGGLFQSVMAPFSDFVLREKYPTLDLGGSSTATSKKYTLL